MPKKTEMYDIKVKRLEQKKKSLKVIFEYPLGETFIEVDKKDLNLFSQGKKYEGVFVISGISDFPGDEDKWENVCTISYSLEKILDNDKIIYENK